VGRLWDLGLLRAVLLGHGSVATTAIYTQPGEADLAEAVEGLE